MTTTRVVVVKLRCLHANCWGAKCAACGAWLTKHDWDAGDAERNAEDAFDRTDELRHVCPNGQLVLGAA